MSDKSKRLDHDKPDNHDHDTDDDHDQPRVATIWNGRHGSTLVGALCFGVLGLLIVFQVAC